MWTFYPLPPLWAISLNKANPLPCPHSLWMPPKGPYKKSWTDFLGFAEFGSSPQLFTLFMNNPLTYLDMFQSTMSNESFQILKICSLWNIISHILCIKLNFLMKIHKPQNDKRHNLCRIKEADFCMQLGHNFLQIPLLKTHLEIPLLI